MIDSVNTWFKITEYKNNKATKIEKLVETTWLVQYPWPVEITYDQGGVFLGHKFKSNFIEQEYGIKTRPTYPREYTCKCNHIKNK